MPPQLRKGKQEEQLICHARKDLIEFACEDDQQDSILYLGFNQAQDDDEEFQIGEGEEEAGAGLRGEEEAATGGEGALRHALRRRRGAPRHRVWNRGR